ncbi:2,3-butanediol dehydrogenase [Lachnospiraceae bacterium 48-21]
MKATRFYTAKDLRIGEVDLPAPKDDEVQIKVKFAGICGSDLHEYEGGPIFTPGENPQYITGCTNPVTIGHEFAGVVSAIGPNVKNFKVGDRVIPRPLVTCGKCASCLSGNYNTCDHLNFIGYSSDNGGFAEYANFTEKFVHHMPDNMKFEQGALVEPLAVSYHCLGVGHFKAGDVAVVAGAGPIGLGIMAALKAKGAGKIIAVQRKGIRQENAHKYADIVLDPNDNDVTVEINKITNGKGADVCFEATSDGSAFAVLFDSIKAGGYVVVVSLSTKAFEVDPMDLVMHERHIAGSLCYTYQDYEDVISLLSSGKLEIPGFITKKIALDDIVKEGFEVLTGPEKKKQIKILVTPEPELLGK